MPYQATMVRPTSSSEDLSCTAGKHLVDQLLRLATFQLASYQVATSLLPKLGAGTIGYVLALALPARVFLPFLVAGEFATVPQESSQVEAALLEAYLQSA